MEKDRLDISLNQFKNLKKKDKDEVMFQNLVHIRQTFAEMKQSFEDNKFHRKFHYLWLSVLTVFVGAKKYLGI